MRVAAGLPVGAGGAGEFSDPIVVGGECAGLTGCSQILGGIKAESGGVAQASGAPSTVACGVGLRGVFQELKVMGMGDRAEARPCLRGGRKDGPARWPWFWG